MPNMSTSTSLLSISSGHLEHQPHEVNFFKFKHTEDVRDLFKAAMLAISVSKENLFFPPV